MSAEATPKHNERAHAVLSASASSRWLHCTAAPRLEEKFPDTKSTAADEGTLAHELSEIKLNSRIALLYKRKSTPEQTRERREAVDRIINHPLYNAEMEDYTDEYVAYVMETFNAALAEDPDAEIFVEVKTDLTVYIPEGFGTSDVVILCRGWVIVIDFKYGKGVRVSAQNNSQGKLYALGILEMFKRDYAVHTVQMQIVQPRLGSIDVWETTVSELKEWAVMTVVPKAREAFAGTGPQITGSWCQFCKARIGCKALKDDALSYAIRLFGEEDSLVSTEDLIEVYEAASRISGYLSAVTSYLYKQAYNGKKLPGYKLVEGRATRKITDPEALKINLMLEGVPVKDITKTELLSMTVLEKQIGKETFKRIAGRLITRPPGKPSLVPESDQRRAMEINRLADAVAAFGDEDQTEND